MYTPHTQCRACGFGKPFAPGTKSGEPERLKKVFDLSIQPLANDFQPENGERAGYAPLEVLYCPRCTLAQLSVTVRPDILYSNYSYVTSPSVTMKVHFDTLCIDIGKERGSVKSVLEIGSNDGRFLKFCEGFGAQKSVGIDPARNLVDQAEKLGVKSICGLFGVPNAHNIKALYGDFDIIVARHVFCHVDDWRDFVTGLEVLATKDTLICIEVPYVLDMLERGEFDTIYHEHTSYLSIRAMLALLEGTSLRLHKVIKYPIHGGAILMMLRHRDSGIIPDESVDQFLYWETGMEEKWEHFSQTSTSKIYNLKTMVDSLSTKGRRICGYGASAKSTVWVNACGFSRVQLEAIYDGTPQKQFKFSPGTNIPIKHEGAFFADACDYAVMFCWNFESECLAKNKKWLEGGGRFIIPHPTIRIVSKDGVE
jgi:hypothetical protein